MTQIRVVLVVMALAASMSARSQSAPAKIDASAVWQISPQFLATAPAACGKSNSENIECLAAQMTKAGASPQAVRFTWELYKQSHGDFGIMTGFQNLGVLAFAWITYPLRPNSIYGVVLLNGQPPIVNVEDLALLDTKTMKQSSQFRDIRNQLPQVDLWPGDRDGKTWPEAQARPDGGRQFVLSYPLRDGCQACAHAGVAIFTWNFDAQGRFLGTTFQGLLDPPLSSCLALSDHNVR